MTPLQALYALFQAPTEDANVSNVQLVNGYSGTWVNLSAYALSVDAINATTYDLAIRQASADQFVTTSLACCFAAICEGMAGKTKSRDYRTAEDVDADLGSLTDKWAFLSARSLDPIVRDAIADIYRKISRILQNVEVTLPRVIVLDAPVVPASVLSYWLYDTDANEQTIIDLNPNLSPMLYDGDVDVLSVRV